jgi:uncharacterized delta-60 repeat protein
LSSLLLLPSGQVMAVGTGLGSNGYAAFALARYNANGSLDSSFGSGGIVTASPTGGDVVDGAALQSNGQIVVVGWGGQDLRNTSGSLFEVGVFNSNGSVDASFGSGGFVSQPVFSDGAAIIVDSGGGVVIQPDGKIVTAASGNGTNGFADFLLARYDPSTAQIGSFTASTSPATGSSVTLTASNITLADPNSTITQVAFYVQVNGSNTLLGYGTQSSPGVWTFSYTVKQSLRKSDTDSAGPA